MITQNAHGLILSTSQAKEVAGSGLKCWQPIMQLLIEPLNLERILPAPQNKVMKSSDPLMHYTRIESSLVRPEVQSWDEQRQRQKDLVLFISSLFVSLLPDPFILGAYLNPLIEFFCNLKFSHPREEPYLHNWVHGKL
jgi:hypothetical protein